MSDNQTAKEAALAVLRKRHAPGSEIAQAVLSAEITDAVIAALDAGQPQPQATTKPVAELIREVAAADPEAHRRALGRAYGVGPAVEPQTEPQREFDDSTDVLTFIREDGPVPWSVLCERFPVSRRYLALHVQRLIDAGGIEATVHGLRSVAAPVGVDPQEPQTEIERVESTINGRLAMAKVALESAQGAYDDAIAAGRDPDAPMPSRPRRRRAGVDLPAPTQDAATHESQIVHVVQNRAPSELSYIVPASEVAAFVDRWRAENPGQWLRGGSMPAVPWRGYERIPVEYYPSASPVVGLCPSPPTEKGSAE